MKTLAEIKRRAVVGSQLTLVSYKINDVEAPVCKVRGITRRVKTVQTNQIQFEPHTQGARGSWLDWPKASEVKILDANAFEINYKNDCVTLTYCFS